MTTEKKSVAMDNRALLDALTVMYQPMASDLANIKSSLDQILGLINGLSQKPVRARAAAATSEAAKAKPPTTVKSWFIAKYLQSETERALFAEHVNAIHASVVYSQTKEADRLKKEATMIYDNILNGRTDYQVKLNEYKKEFEAQRAKLKQQAGHVSPAAAPSASADPASSDAPIAAAKPKRARANKKVDAKKAPVARLEDIAAENEDADENSDS
jgi:hypothetical protein